MSDVSREDLDDRRSSSLAEVSLDDVPGILSPALSRETVLRFLCISRDVLLGGLDPRSLLPLVTSGAVDVLFISPLLLDLDLGLGHPGPARERPTARSPKTGNEGRGLLLLRDVTMDRRLLHHPHHYVPMIFTAPPFQKIMPTATVCRLLGLYLKERERILSEPAGLLSAAHDAGAPVYTPYVMSSRIGKIIAGLALDGNRLTPDPALDLNEAAGLVLESRRPGKGCLLISFGGGESLAFVLRAAQHVQETLGIRSAPHEDTTLLLVDPPDSLPGRSSPVEVLKREGYASSYKAYRSVSPAADAVRVVSEAAAAWPRPSPRNLEDERDDIWERLRKAHVEATALKGWTPIKMKFPGRG